MGLAENQLSFDLLESWMALNPEAAAFKNPEGESVFRQLALFQDYHGLPEFKNAMAQFMSEIRGNKVDFDADNLVLTAGSTSANETLIFCLANPGDAFLLPTPYYPGFDRDLKWRTGAEIVPIQCFSSNNFRITESALEDAYKEAQKRKLKVKGVLVTNPSNPAMEVLSELKDKTDDVWERVHIVYSLSKDLGLPGFRVGALYSNDKMVVSAATKMSSFGLISSQTQYLLAAMLSDKKFTKKYLSENQKRLKERHEMLVAGLREAGIECLESNAGLFCWVDMRHLLSSNTFEAEMELWKKIVYQVGLNISAGSSCHCTEPGWFRLCFADMSEETLGLAMKRISSFVASEQPVTTGTTSPRNSNKSSRRKGFTKWVLRLSQNNDQKMKFLSDKVTNNSHGQDSSYFLGWQEYEKNPYDEIKNPKGIIQMGLAENQLSFDLLESWMALNPEAAAFQNPEGESVFRQLALFQDYHGLPEFKNAMAQFMSEIRGNKFTKKYLSENQKRLKERHEMLVAGLREAGIECLESNAGLFCWVDMRHLLSSNTFEAEMELWKKIVYQVGLNISPGSSCHCTEPGWFRLCFANMSEETLALALKRISSFVASEQPASTGTTSPRTSNKSSKRKGFTKWVFRLSQNNDRNRER
ncbi:unnamed protein product [Cuscuta campestris]|uniref:1-aminocyclopropane-1-carboxylate synthase n=1 Tax=Cuscuta campestris TaxID=132261 RepID=A0A484NGF4_9ASTE|nr:unnamed protein product [Cuscuta campestris]